MKNRIISIVLCLLIVIPAFSIAPVSASARDDIQLLVDLDILQPRKRSGLIDRGFTRSSFARIIAKMTDIYNNNSGLGASMAAVKEYATDIENNANKNEIVYVLANGFMKTEDGSFNPNSPVTYADAVYALVNRLNYYPLVYEYGGDEGAYNKIASQLGLLKGVTINDSSKLSYDEVSRLVANAMNIGIFENKPISYGGTVTIYDWWEVKENRGRILATSSFGISTPAAPSGSVNIDGSVYKTNILIPNKYIGAEVTFYTREINGNLTVVSVSFDEEGSTLTLNADDIGSAAKSGKDFVITYGEKNKKIKFSQSGYAIVNGKTLSPTTELLNAFKSGEVTFLDSDGDGKYDVANMLMFRQDVVASVSAVNEAVTFEYQTGKVSVDDLSVAEIYINGKAAKLTELQTGMIVGIAADDFGIVGGEIENDLVNSKKVWLYASSNKSKGYVDSVSNTAVVMDELEYKFGAGYRRLVAENKIQPLSPGDAVILRFDYYGYIADYETDMDIAAMQYGYLIKSVYDTSNSMNPVLLLKIMDTEGNKKIYKVNKRFVLDGVTVTPTGTVFTVATANGNVDVDLAKRQAVRFYAADEDVLKELDTAAVRIGEETAENSLDTAIAYDTTVSPAPEGVKISDGNIGRQFTFAADAVLFIDEAERQDDSPEDKLFSVTNNFTSLTRTQKIAAYDANDVKEVKCVVQYKNLDGAGSSSNTDLKTVSNGFVVEKIVDTIDKDGEEGWMLTLCGADKKQEYFVAQDNVNLAVVTGQWNTGSDWNPLVDRVDASAFKTVIKSGDIVRFTTNTAGNITYLEKIFDFTYNYNANTANYGIRGVEAGVLAGTGAVNPNTANIYTGFVKSKKVIGTTVVFTEGTDTEYVFKIRTANYPTVPVYYVNKKQVVMTAYDELPSEAKGDNANIFVRFYDDANIRDSIFYVFD